MVLERAEPAGEAHVLRVGELLVAEEHDEVVVQRLLDRGHGGRIVGCRREVDAAQLGADGRGEGHDLDGAHAHGLLLVRVAASRARRKTGRRSLPRTLPPVAVRISVAARWRPRSPHATTTRAS
jgi:hypothetical protein